jgi:hypothetical protein
MITVAASSVLVISAIVATARLPWMEQCAIVEVGISGDSCVNFVIANGNTIVGDSRGSVCVDSTLSPEFRRAWQVQSRRKYTGTFTDCWATTHGVVIEAPHPLAIWMCCVFVLAWGWHLKTAWAEIVNWGKPVRPVKTPRVRRELAIRPSPRDYISKCLDNDKTEGSFLAEGAPTPLDSLEDGTLLQPFDDGMVMYAKPTSPCWPILIKITAGLDSGKSRVDTDKIDPDVFSFVNAWMEFTDIDVHTRTTCPDGTESVTWHKPQ